MLDWPKSEI